MIHLDDFGLKDKVVLVTGASSGLGRHCAIDLAGLGAQVVLAARRRELLDEVAAEIESTGGRALSVAVDVADPGSCDEAVGRAFEEFGRLDVLVNFAGIALAAPATRERPDDFRKVLDINLNGTYWMAQAAGRRMAPGGSIVNIGSVLGYTTAHLPNAAYAASKSALIGLTRDLAAQWSGRKGIRVNLVVPGYFPSEMTHGLSQEYLDADVLPRVPVGRLGRPSECTACVAFLASDASSYVTGTALVVDGGLLTG